MKTIKMSALFCALNLVMIFTTVGNTNDIAPQKGVSSTSNSIDIQKIKVTVKIDWGRKSRDCAGFGICKISTSISLETGLRVSATNDGKLMLEISKNSYVAITEYFNGSKIIVEEDFRLEEDIAKKIELETGYTVRKGSYSIIQGNDGNYQVIL